MTESTLEPPSGFEYGTIGLGIQHLNHQATAPCVGINHGNNHVSIGIYQLNIGEAFKYILVKYW